MKNLIALLFFSCLLAACSSPQNAEDIANTEEKPFKSIFDGETLTGWLGDITYWHAEEGVLIGEITPETLLKSNSFIIWEGGELGDFEFKAEFHVAESGNSGVNYRSVMHEDIPFALRGYQADIDGKNKYTGQNYEERGRATLGYRGQITSINAQSGEFDLKAVRSKVQRNAWPDLEVIGSLGESEDLKAKINKQDWNEIHLVVKGNRLQHYVNGVLMSDVTDNDEVNGKSSGLLGMQVHVGPPMRVMYRNIRIKEL